MAGVAVAVPRRFCPNGIRFFVAGGERRAQDDSSELPAPLLEAISSRAGGRVVLVLGAGCSYEDPPGLPLAGQLAERCFNELVADGVLSADACSDSQDLSAVADAVVAASGDQCPLVERFPPDRFRLAEPNDGYQLAALLMRERALHAILTLNFDLAALTELGAAGAGDEVTVIEGPEDFGRLGGTNLVYLHSAIIDQLFIVRDNRSGSPVTGRRSLNSWATSRRSRAALR